MSEGLLYLVVLQPMKKKVELLPSQYPRHCFHLSINSNLFHGEGVSADVKLPEKKEKSISRVEIIEFYERVLKHTKDFNDKLGLVGIS